MTTLNSIPQYLQKKAEELNKRAHDIAFPLFLFCNYEDPKLPTFSSYDRFTQAIQELYKFCVDCCPLNQVFLKHPPRYPYIAEHLREVPEDQRKEYAQICKQIRVLRAVYDHNNSERNGGIQQETLDEFRTVFVAITGFEYDAADLDGESFGFACDNLLNYAEKVVDFTESFVVRIESLPEVEKAAVAREWKDRILYWYSKNTKRDYFRGYIAPDLPFEEFENYTVRQGSTRKRLGEHIREIVDKNNDCIRKLETEAKYEALDEFKRTYENGVELSDEWAANTPQEAERRLKEVNGQLEAIIRVLPERKYGGRFLDKMCQTALFEATVQLYPICSLLPHDFYDYVVYKLLILN